MLMSMKVSFHQGYGWLLNLIGFKKAFVLYVDMDVKIDT